MLKIGFVSLGCSKNQVDTEVMLGIMAKHNLTITNEPSEADIIVVNTCSFIQAAREEAVTTILDMAEFKKDGQCRGLIVAGCLVQRYGKTLLEELPEVDAFVGTGSWDKIMEAIDAVLTGKRIALLGDSKIIYNSQNPRLITTPFYSNYVKIAEGCNHRCAFCSIPLMRGNYRSRSIEDIEQEVRRLVERGAKEINLIAQDTTNYGYDLYKQTALPQLLRSLVKIDGLHWIRLQYTYPHSFTDELIDLMASEPKICKYVDIPLQHAHNAVLRRMRRADTREYIETLLQKIRTRVPGVSVRTTFIVGFPGETEEEYQALYQFVKEQKFDKVGVFTYSREEDTPAYDLPNQVSEDIMQDRYHNLMSLQSQISEEVNRNLEGKIFEVLVEGRDEEQPDNAYGRSYREAPDVDGRIYVENAGNCKPGDIIKVRIEQGFVYDLLGVRV